jgi:hypothetical protein
MKVNMYYLTVPLALMTWALVGSGQIVRADSKDAENANPENSASAPQSTGEMQPYLGVAIEPLHPGFASHLPNVLIRGQGVLVNDVFADSPAAKAGIKQDDILVQYGDQKLFSAEQLAKLVLADKTGSEVSLKLVRSGKLETVHVTLGEETRTDAILQAGRPWWRDFAFPLYSPARTLHARRNNDMTDSSWQSFDSMTLKRLDNGQFQAEIRYLNEDGKAEQQVFKGTREEIEKAIKSERDLPASERDHLLTAIEYPQHVMLSPDFGSGQGDMWLNWNSFPIDF